MVDRTLIRAKVNFGLGKAGVILGYPIAQYRPVAIAAPVSAGTLLGTLTGDLDSHAALDFKQQPKIGATQFFLLGDTTNLLVGDYLVGQGTGPDEADTYFVAATGGVEPAMCVRCNATVNLLRPARQSQAGQNAYGGQTAATDVPIMTGWPASVMIKRAGGAGPAGLPGDDKFGMYEVLLPALAGVALRTSDILTDDLVVNGAVRRFTVSASELSPPGWRLLAQITVT